MNASAFSLLIHQIPKCCIHRVLLCGGVKEQKAVRYQRCLACPTIAVRGVRKALCTQEMSPFKHMPENTVVIDAVSHEVFHLFKFV